MTLCRNYFFATKFGFVKNGANPNASSLVVEICCDDGQFESPQRGLVGVGVAVRVWLGVGVGVPPRTASRRTKGFGMDYAEHRRLYPAILLGTPMVPSPHLQGDVRIFRVQQQPIQEELDADSVVQLLGMIRSTLLQRSIVRAY